ncbi:hypothetical protein CFP56_021437 [Quercus suber]|uniref:Late embryogenesis abundant protein LEA-2 subgroup domain-containing protein n=1 Tax=Quercus suber TaxID=58331 RepID=A0AAW0KDV5_QUESU
MDVEKRITGETETGLVAVPRFSFKKPIQGVPQRHSRIDLSVKNPNKAGFKYSNSTAYLNYRGQLVGEVPIPADQISAGETKPMNISLTLLADRLLSNSDLYSDVKSGVLALNSNVRLLGKSKSWVLRFTLFQPRL